MPAILMVQRTDNVKADRIANARCFKADMVLSVCKADAEFSQWERDNLDFYYVSDAEPHELAYLTEHEQERDGEIDPTAAKPPRRIKIDFSQVVKEPQSKARTKQGDEKVDTIEIKSSALQKFEALAPELPGLIVIG